MKYLFLPHTNATYLNVGKSSPLPTFLHFFFSETTRLTISPDRVTQLDEVLLRLFIVIYILTNEKQQSLHPDKAMSKKEKADIKLAYQTAAEIAHIIAVGLSRIEQNQTRKLIQQQQQPG